VPRQEGSSCLDSQRIRFLFDQGLSGLVTSGVAALLTAVLVRSAAPTYSLLMWLAAMWGILLARIGLLVAWRRIAPPDTSLRRWCRAYLLGAGLGGLSWGMLPVTIGPQAPQSAVLVVYLVIAGIAAAGISSNAVLMGAYLAFLVPIVLGVGASLVHGAQGLDFATVGFVLLYGIGLALIARSYSTRLVRFLELAQTLKVANLDLRMEMERRTDAQAEIEQTRRLFMAGSVVAFRWGSEEGWPVLNVSPNARRLGLDPDRLVREHTRYADLIHPDDLASVATRAPNPVGPTGMPFFEMDYRIRLPDGGVRWVYDYKVEVRDKEGHLVCYEGYLLDISDRKQIEEALRAEKDLAQITLHSIAEGVLSTDNEQRVAYMNPVAERLTGWPLDLALGRRLDQVLRLESLTPGNSERGSWADMGYRLLRRRDGGFFTISHSVAAVLDDSGHARGTVWVLHDVTETRALAEELAHQASHDALTGLLNRREFEIRLQHALHTAQADGLSHICLYLDLDQFKIVNDTCGHSAGDSLLRQLTGMLQDRVRDSDALARLGGDEFGILLQSCSVDKGRELAEGLLRQLRDFRFFSDGKMFEVGASIGLAAVTAESGRVETVLSCADMACYAAKDLGRNRVHVYQTADSDLLRRHGEMQWVTRITEALAEDRLELVGQPIRPIEGRGEGRDWREALVRLRNPDGSLSDASEFLPAAERYNLAPHVDRWVVDQALSWLGAQESQHRLLIGINVSGVTLSDERFLGFIEARLSRFQVDPNAVCFEITETAAIANFRAAGRFIAELRRLGCRFALDDFGSGLSSFAYLKNLPVDYLKVDGSFVRDMLDDPLDRAMVQLIVDVGSIMGIRTVAEHVETPAAGKALAEMGVDYLQGFGVADTTPLGA